MAFGDKIEDFYKNARWPQPGWPSDTLQKADDPVLTTTSNYTDTYYGPSVFRWLAMEEKGLFSILPKEVWPAPPGDGIRIETGRPVGELGQLENSTLNDTDKPGVTVYRVPAKVLDKPFEITLHAELNTNDPVGGGQWSYLRDSMGKHFADRINAQLGVDAQSTGSATIDLESIDRLISSRSEATNIFTNATAANPYGGNAAPLIRGGTGIVSTSDSVVLHNDNVDRPLTLALLDSAIQQVEDNGANRRDLVMVTGRDTAFQLGRLLGARERYTNPTNITVGMGGVTQTGAETGFEVATYHDIPIIPILRLPTDGATRIYGIDTSHIKMRVAQPTTYVESGDYIQFDNMKRKGMYSMAGELTMTRPDTSFKIRDLLAS